jgi:uncharacterized membrane protein
VNTLEEKDQPVFQAETHPSKDAPGRGRRFLIGGIGGGTLLVAVMSLAVRDWSYLTRWVSGVFAVALAAAVIAAKSSLERRVARLMEED